MCVCNGTRQWVSVNPNVDAPLAVQLENMMERRRKVEEYEAMLEQLRLAEIDDYNVIREKLETDVQVRKDTRTDTHTHISTHKYI